MLFLFENALTPYIYSVFYTLICRAQSSQSLQLLSCEQTRHTDPPHPRPDPSSLTPMSNHTRTASGRTPTATPSPTSRATFTPMSNHTQSDTQGAHTDRHTITPPGVGISLLSRG